MTSKNKNLQQDRYLFIALLTLIALLPLPHGGELPWEHAPFISGTFLLLTIWLFQQWRHNRPLPNIINSTKIPLALFCIWLTYIFIQTIPLPDHLLSLLSPATHDLNQHARIAGAITENSLSIDPASTFQELLRYASYITIFFLTLALCDTPSRLIQLTATLFLVGAALAFYSLLNYYTSGAFSLNEPIPSWGGTAWSKATRGTYTHYNHFAALMEMTIPMGVALILITVKHTSRAAHWQHQLNHLLNFMMSVRMLYSFLVVLMLVALIFTASRGGNISFASAFFITSLIFLLLRGRQSHKMKLTPILIVVIFLIAALIGTSKLSDRFEKDGLDSHGRDHIRTTVVKLISDYPLFGSGSGTYPQLFAAYKLPELGVSAMSKRVQRAHNDYLELISDQGLIGFGIFGSGIALLLYKILSGIRQRRNPTMTGLLYGATFAITSLLIHAFVEFNFHIPANASYFFVLLAIGTIAANLRNSSE